MTREELVALRDAIDMTLALPDSLRELLAQWLMPAAAKPNGHDPYPPPVTRSVDVQERNISFRPRQAKARRGKPPTSPKAAERALLAAMHDNPGLSIVALANAVGSSRTATGERLRQLAQRGIVEKDLTGRWKL
jgi:hypothetical protein